MTNTNTTVNPYTTIFTYTYSFGSYSCVSAMYPAHIAAVYLVSFLGIMALLSRVVPKLLPYHVWFGRGYMVAMYWAFGTSLLIHNNGLPLFVIIFFTMLLISLSIGWIVIKFHVSDLEKKAFMMAQNTILEMKGVFQSNFDLAILVADEKAKILLNQTFLQRFFSLKNLHGIMMAISWIDITARLLGVNPVKGTTPGLPHGANYCYTYPAYKGDVAQFVKEEWPNLPQGSEFLVPTLFYLTLPFVAASAVANFWFAWRAKQERKGESMSLSDYSPLKSIPKF